MAFTSVFTSSQSQRRWRNHMTHNYVSIHRIRPCVFQVPDNLRETKPEAYTPQLVGLGPYHHFRAELQHMEILKRQAVLDYLKIVKIEDFIGYAENVPADVEDKIQKFTRLIAESPMDFEPKIRSSYDRFLDLDKRTLAWVVIVDGLFLMHFLDTYLDTDTPKEEKEKIYSNSAALVADVLMLENQIPIVLIQKMREHLQQTYNVGSDHQLFDKFQRFCRKQSPLKLTTDTVSIDEAFDNSNHMLHFLYQMIVKNKRAPAGCSQEDISQDNEDDDDDSDEEDDEERENSQKIQEENGPTLGRGVGDKAQVIASLGQGILEQAIEEFNSALSDAKSAGIKVSVNIEKVSNILQNLQKTLHLNHKTDSLGDQIDIPSASRLNAIVQITFKPLPKCCGIGDICLDKDEKILYLPVITLRANSEVILRNLVAYEAASKMGSTQMRDYVDLMCGIVKSGKDVKLLKDAKIIRGKIPAGQIVRMCKGIKESVCNGIKKSDEKPDEKSKGSKKSDEKPDEKSKGTKKSDETPDEKKSNVQSTVDKVNKKFNDATIVKACKSTRKCFAGCLKSFKPLFPIMVLLLLALQSFCEIYDCRRSSYLPNLHSGELDSEARLMLPRKVYRY